MRKLLSFLILSMTCIMASAFTVDGICYNIVSSADNTVKVVSKSGGYSGNVAIPSTVTYNGTLYTVSGIGQAAFADDSTLTGVTLPETINSIEYEAFKNCTSLSGSIVIPSGVTYIPTRTFSGCSSLESVTMDEGVTILGLQSFYGCTSLTSVNMPDSLRQIGSLAFYNCSSLSGDLVIPENVEEVPYQAFYNCSSLSSLTLPDSLKLINNEAFYNCTGLTGTVEVPEGTTLLATNSFYNCSNITDVVLPSTLRTIAPLTFAMCTSLESINIPSGVTSIGDLAFFDCASLSSKIEIPEGITSLGYGVFANCSSLSDVSLPSTLTSLGDLAFYECTNLETLNLPDNLSSLGFECFKNCISWDGTVTIPSTITEIPTRAFFGCMSIDKFIIPETVTSIGTMAFGICTDLKTVNLPKGLTYLGDEAFYSCSSLSCDIEVPSGITELAFGMFWDCSSLTSVKLPSTMTEIGSLAFANCYSLSEIDIPESVTIMGYECLRHTNISELLLPENVSEVGSRAFTGCDNLQKVVSRAVSAPYCDNDDRFTEYDIPLYIPDGSTQSYSTSNTWRNFFNVESYSDTTIWTGLADNDWSNDDNWTSKAPSSQLSRKALIKKVGSEVLLSDGTSVVVSNYPIISGTRHGSSETYNNTVTCDTIIFDEGAGVLGLENLTYNKAFVKASFDIDRWYMITSPLKEMYTADFYFNGNPLTYISKFYSSEGTTSTSYWFKSFSSLQEKLSAGTGFAFKAAAECKDGTKTESSSLSVTFPRTDEYGELIDSYYMYNPLTGKLLKSAKKVAKTEDAYRFAIEDENGKLPSTYEVALTSSEYTLVGNPIMTHLDLSAFYSHNSSAIEPSIVLISADNGNTSVIANGEGLKTASSTAETMIAPMQSFFVKSKDDATENSVTFDLSSDFTTDNSGTCVLKSSYKSKDPALYVTCAADGVNSGLSLWLNSKASNGYSKLEDAEKLFSGKIVNEVYTEADGVKLDINQFSTLPYEAPISVTGANKNDTVDLAFKGAESFENVNVTLVNKQTGEEINLKDETSYKFAFNGQTAQGTLYVRFSDASQIRTAVEEGEIIVGESSAVKIYSSGSKIRVESTSADLSEVSVYDMSGRKISTTKLTNASTYETQPLSGSVIVRVVSENGVKVEKLTIK